MRWKPFACMRNLGPPLLAVVSGLVAVLAASVSLMGETPGMGVTGPDPLLAYLLLTLGVVVLANGVLMLLLTIPMRAQGAAMLLYGILMILAGTSMTFTNLFAMEMSLPSAMAMYVLGALMVVSGRLMIVGKMTGTEMGEG